MPKKSKKEQIGTIYLIHFDSPLAHAKHYLGWTGGETIEERMKRHASGTGARLLRVLRDIGIGWTLVRIWPDKTKRDERKMKKRGKSYICPICNDELDDVGPVPQFRCLPISGPPCAGKTILMEIVPQEEEIPF